MDIPLNKYDIYIECGADFSLSFVIRDDSGTLVNLSEATIEAQLREYAEAQEYLLFTAVHNGAGGRITLTMPHEDTANIGYTAGVYDVYLTLDGVTEKIVYGDVTVYSNVTKPVEGEIMYLLSFNTEEDLPAVGMMRRVYFCHASSFMYRWNGTAYVGMNMNTYWDDIPDKPETFPPSEHTHDDRYYTETETDTLLSGKSDTGHTHDDRYYTETETDTLLSGKSDTSHTHDDRYYTESEMDTALAGKSDTSHTHDDRYYTESEVDTFLSTKADSADLGDLAEKDTVDWDSDITNIPEDFPPSSHDHDDRYYTEDEMDTLLSAKADSADLGDLAAKDKVDWDTDIDDIPTTFPPESHTHDDRYYTESEIDTALSGKSDTSHTHDDRYYTETETDALLSEKADIIHTSASGALVHLTDAGAYPVDALTVGIEPVQDLHGYSNPWSAGGGKNLLPPLSQTTETNGITFRLNSDGSIFISGTASATAFVDLGRGNLTLPSGTYYLSLHQQGTASLYFIIYKNSSPAEVIKGSAGDFTLSESTSIFVRVQVSSGTAITSGVTIYPMIEQGSSATSYAPYSNICPISGHNSAVVTRTGTNIWDEEWEKGQLINGQNADRNTRIRSKNYISVKPNVTYYFDYDATKGFALAYYGFDKSFISQAWTNDHAITIPSNVYYVRFATGDAYGGTYLNDISINYPSTDTAYHAYSGTSVTIALGSTVYGGQLNVLTGEMTVDRAMVDMGTMSWNNGQSAPSRFYSSSLSSLIRHPSTATEGATLVLCSQYASSKLVITDYQNPDNDALISAYSDNNIYVLDRRYTDTNAFTTAMSGVQLVYELATPLTVQLSPATLSLLLGENNIWADTGQTSVGYRADTKLYIDSKLASAVAELQALILENS